MALEYKSQLGLEMIMPVLDEYIVWYGDLVQSFFAKQAPSKNPHQTFDRWIDKAVSDGSMSPDLAARVRGIQEDLVRAAEKFMARTALPEDMPAKEFADLTGHYEEFIQFMRRMEMDQALENSGFDERTGLRSAKVMKEDIARELERRARRGNPFSLALVRIAEYKPEWTAQADGMQVLIAKLAEQIRASLRSFDDAYYLGEEYFVLSLKHADNIGSQAAIARLNNAIKLAHIPLPDDPIKDVSIVTVVAEPAPGDDVDALLANMKKDLDGIDARGTVVQYNDISPLQRYIHSIGKDA